MLNHNVIFSKPFNDKLNGIVPRVDAKSMEVTRWIPATMLAMLRQWHLHMTEA